MADPRFFKAVGPFKLGYLAEKADSELSAGADPERSITDVAPLGSASSTEISFLDNKLYLDEFAASGAGGCIVDPRLAPTFAAG